MGTHRSNQHSHRTRGIRGGLTALTCIALAACAAETAEQPFNPSDYSLEGTVLDNGNADPALQKEALLSEAGRDGEPALDDILSAEEQLEAMAALSDLGVDVSSARLHVFHGKALINAEGINYNARKLLDGAYDPIQVGGDIAKGYRVASANPPVGFSWSRNIELIAGRNFDDPILQIFAEAAAINWSEAQWNGFTPNQLDISFDNTGPNGSDITLHFVPVDQWLTTTPCFFAFACIDEFPSGQRPSRNIYIIQDKTPLSGCPWTGEAFYRVLQHELGHAIGFKHPHQDGDGDKAHIPGTLSESSNPGYKTIMRTNLDLCGPLDFFLLQPDDRLSAVLTYLSW